MLIQPSRGQLVIFTECGQLEVEPGTIAVIPKNMKFQVNLASQED
jgi:homogentisate 1,2-dioxygenase